jgi:SAM-dependent methyltransferase
MIDLKQHWEDVYTTKPADRVSWFQEHPRVSLDLIRRTGVGPDAPILDVGGGASTLVDDLIAEGYRDLTVLDISAAGLGVARRRLGRAGDRVRWLVADVTRADLPAAHYHLWHDRAVFHFLTDPGDRERYVRQVAASVRPGGHVIVAAFGPEGPTRCSGLEVARYSSEALHDEFGPAFELVEHVEEAHHTPFGTDQQFVYCYCRKP